MLIYPNVSPAQIEAAKQKLAADPAYLLTDNGPNVFTVQSSGFTIHAHYEPGSQVLSVDANLLIRGRVDAGIKAALGRS